VRYQTCSGFLGAETGNIGSVLSAGRGFRWPSSRDLRLFLWCARRWRIPLTRNLLLVSTLRQRMAWLELDRASQLRLRRVFRVSTSRYGTGQVMDSLRTPLGLHRVAAKMGAYALPGTVFRGRKPAGFTWQGQANARIAHRIFWLEGLELGYNRGGCLDSFARFIYIHGLANELQLGTPDSCGCVHLAASDLLPMFDRIPVGTLVWIAL
jgi:hypothetical protein